MILGLRKCGSARLIELASGVTLGKLGTQSFGLADDREFFRQALFFGGFELVERLGIDVGFHIFEEQRIAEQIAQLLLAELDMRWNEMADRGGLPTPSEIRALI